MENKGNNKGLLKTLAERSKADTPPFFKKLRIVGLSLAAVGGVLVAAPFAIPAVLVTLGGYLVVAGSVATAVSQVAVTNDGSAEKESTNP